MTFAYPLILYSLPPFTVAFWLLYRYGQKRKTNLKKRFSELYLKNRPLAEPRILVSGQEKIKEEPECTQAYMRIPSLFLTNLKNKRQRLSKRSNNSLTNYHTPRHRLKVSLLYSAALCLFISLSRPQKGFLTVEIQGKNIEIVFALDTSKSMLAQDIKPNRLSRAKLAIQDVLESLQGDRIGLIAFAGRSFLECPLTLDYQAFLQSLEACDTAIITQGGTDFAAAIDQASKAFSKQDSHKALIFISDGEDLEKAGYKRAIAAKEEGISIYTVGVGTAAGDIIPILDKNGKQDYLRDAQGQIVKSRLEEDTLKSMAQITGGFYTPLGPKGEGLQQVYKHLQQSIPAQERQSFYKTVPKEYFQWPLGLACVLLLLEIAVPTYARKRSSCL